LTLAVRRSYRAKAMKLGLLSLVAATFVFSASVLADDAEEIRRLDKEITVATWTGDAVWFEKNMADDFVLITASGSMRTKRDLIRQLSTPGLKMEPYEASEVQIRMYGETAVVTGRILQRYVLGGVRYANDLRYTDTYAKRGGKWMMVSGHASMVSPR
jgi:uncharacterized protein (TIGR02246 family)